MSEKLTYTSIHNLPLAEFIIWHNPCKDFFLFGCEKKNWFRETKKKTIGKTADKRRNKFEKLK